MITLHALLGALVLFLGGGGGASTQSWSHTGPVPTFAGQPGHAYVAMTGVEEARAFVAVTQPATSLTLVAADNLLVTAPAIAACPLAQAVPVGDEVAAADQPAAVCDEAVALVPDATATSWTLDLTRLWPAIDRLGAHGVALVPTGTGVWRVGFAVSRTNVDLVAVDPPVAPSADDEGVLIGSDRLQAGEIQSERVASLEGAPPAATATSEVALVRPAQPIDRSRPRSVDRPASLPVLAMAVAGVALVGAGARRRPVGQVRASVPAIPVGKLTAAVAFVVLPAMALSEADVFRVGSVIIVAVAVIGLHMLVNWAGELSLAQAAVVGLPAFAVAKLAADWSVSPLVLLPVGVVVGVAAGVVIGLPSLRARGLQVALVTLAGGVAIERFLFTKSWLVGPPGGVAVPVPTLGPWEFTTSASLYPVLAVVTVASVAAAAVIYRSKIGRALALVRDQPSVAAAYGVPVTRYRLAAYGLAGAYAGLAGGLNAAWVQRLTPGAFPFTLSFTYMVMVVLAGRGFVWGVVAAVALLEGGRVFASGVGPLVAYGGPAALILVVTRYRSGFNGTGRQLMERFRASAIAAVRPSVMTIGGVGAIVIGFLSIGLAWYHAGNTDQVWVQNQLIVSGGLVGLALVILGGLALATERIVRALEKRE